MASTSPSLSTTSDLYVGEKAHLLCAYEEAIIGCKFVIPGVAYEIQLSPTTPSLTTRAGYKFSYYGRGLNHGECGVTIHNLTFSNQGQARCIITTADAESVDENVDIRIKNATEWFSPKISLLNNNHPLKVGQTLMAECIVENYDDDDDEFANLSWHLNNEILTNSSSFQETMRLRGTDGSGKFFSQIKSILKHELRAVDNGKTLKCRFDSFVSNLTSEVEHLLVLESNEMTMPKIGEPYDIVINFTAFPRPLSPKWKVNDRNIYYGKANAEFISRELQYLGSNQWKAVLHVTNVTEESLHRNYSLQVNDAFGSKSYNVRLDDFDNQQQLLSYNVDEDLTSSTKVINLDNERNSIAYSPKPTSFNVKPSTYRRRGTTTVRRIVEESKRDNTMAILEMTSADTTTDAPDHTTEATETTEMPTRMTLLDKTDLVNNFVENSPDARNEDNGRYLVSIIAVSAFILMTIAMIVLISILCSYRQKVVILQREIIQMSSKSFYNYSLSSSYPGLYNIVNLSLDHRSNTLMNISVNSIEVKNEYCVPDYTNSSSEATNSHLYQSIDETNHVYDEIISTKAEQGGGGDGEEKPNNYENNESMNCER